MKAYKIVLIISLQTLLFAACRAQNRKTFELECHINGLKDGTKLYLIRDVESQLDTIACADAKNEKIVFKGSVPKEIDFYWLATDSASSKLKTEKLVLVNNKMQLIGDWNAWPKVSLIGSDLHEQYLEIVKINEKMNAELRQQKADNPTGKIKKVSVFKPYIEAHLNSILTPFLIDYLSDAMDFIDIKQLYDELGHAAKSAHFGVQLKQKLDQLEKLNSIRVGSIVPDFNLTMADGSFASIKGLAAKNKITLVDFWASWCKPCRMENPNLTEVYNAYHAKGFGILGISSDKKAESWKKALAEDKTLWLHGLDTELAGQNIFEIKAIPSYMMIDQDGKIIALELLSPIKGGGPGLRGKVLDETVKKLLNL